MAENIIMKDGHHATVEGKEALSYAQLSKKYMMRDFQNVAAQVVSKLKNGRVLEVGSGVGYIGIESIRLQPELKWVGLETSKTMLDFAKQNCIDEKIGTMIEFVYWDTENVPFGDSSFDFVVSNWSIHHWKKPEYVLNEIYRVLKPGGTVLVFDIRRDATDDDIKNATSHAPDYLSAGLRKSLQEYYIAGEVECILKKTGFSMFTVKNDGMHLVAELKK